MKLQQHFLSASRYKYNSKENNEVSSRISSSDISNEHGRLVVKHNAEEYILGDLTK